MKKLLLSIALLLGFVFATQANTSVAPAMEIDNPSTEMDAFDLSNSSHNMDAEYLFNLEEPTCYKVTPVTVILEDEDGNVIWEGPGTVIEQIPCPE